MKFPDLKSTLRAISAKLGLSPVPLNTFADIRKRLDQVSAMAGIEIRSQQGPAVAALPKPKTEIVPTPDASAVTRPALASKVSQVSAFHGICASMGIRPENVASLAQRSSIENSPAAGAGETAAPKLSGLALVQALFEKQLARGKQPATSTATAERQPTPAGAAHQPPKLFGLARVEAAFKRQLAKA